MLVSVCIPVYKPNPLFLSDLLASIAKQTYSDIEVVIHVDGGAWDTQKIKIPDGWRDRVRIVDEGQRLGMVANWNAAVTVGVGEFVILPGQDDVLEPKAIDSMLKILACTGTQICGSRETYISTEGSTTRSRQRSLGRDRIYREGKTYLLEPKDAIELSLAYGPVFGDPCALLFSRAGFDKVGGFDPEFNHAADLDFTLRLAMAGGGISYVNRALSRRRLHDSNATSRHLKEGIIAGDRKRMFERYAPYLGSERARRRGLARVSSHDFFEAMMMRNLASISQAIMLAYSAGARATLHEICETAGLWRPRGRELVDRCEVPWQS